MAIPHMAHWASELINDEKRAITPRLTSDLLQNCRACRSWQAEHVFSLHLTSISYSFWNKGWQVLTFLKFDEKRAITSRWVIRFTLNLTSISYSFWNKGQKVLKFWKFDEKKRKITPNWVLRLTSKLQGR